MLYEFGRAMVENWFWLLPMLSSGYFLTRMCTAFLPLKPGRGWKLLLYSCLSITTAMVIWVGDNNLLFTLPPFFAVLLFCSKGSRVGRIAVAAVFFCIMMSVAALLDTYLGELMDKLSWGDGTLYDHLTRILRPVVWGLLYLLVRRFLPDKPPQLPARLWWLTLLLASMPLCSLTAIVLMPYSRYRLHSDLQFSLAIQLGLAVLPFVLVTSLAMLAAIMMLADYARLEQLDRLASLRESYYQALQREDRQVRTLRHDLRNHLTALRGLLEREDMGQAVRYLEQLAGSPVLQGSRRLCENEAANAVLAAKAEEMARRGLEGVFSVALPQALPVAEIDLCALLGNALDNAMDGAEQSQDKRISVRCRVERGLFMLRVENAVAGTLEPDLATTKADRSAHGFGLAGMREIAERYGGSLDVRVEKGRFELTAWTPMV